MPRRRRRSGVTLLELMVVLTILSVLAGVTTLAVRRAPVLQATDRRTAAILAARRLAIDSATSVTIVVDLDLVPTPVTARPDGTVLADPRFGVDPLSGKATPPTGDAHAR